MATAEYTIFLLQEAEHDLAQIADYLIRHASLNEAEAIIEKIRARVHALAEFPLRGGVPAELEEVGNRDYRQLLVSRYRIIYRVLDNSVFVMMIADGRRDMRTLLRRRLLA